MHRKYDQPIEDWMNQNDYYGMAQDLRNILNRLHKHIKLHGTQFMHINEIYIMDFDNELYDFETYCLEQASI